MKTRKVRIIIKSTSQLKKEMLDAFHGKKRAVQSDDILVFNGAEAFTKILTANRLDILIYLTNNRPKSIYELAKNLGRDFKNVYTDIKKLSELGLIHLEDSGDVRGGLIPKAKYNEIDLKLTA